jgi:hypothetical protein
MKPWPFLIDDLILLNILIFEVNFIYYLIHN